MKPINQNSQEMAAKLSNLWIFILFNMVFADIFSFMYPGFLQQIVNGNVADGTEITPMFLLIAAIVTEISIAMVILSRFLKPQAARRANLAGAVVTILWVVGGGPLTFPHYIFFASIEVLTCLVIIGMAWNWRTGSLDPLS